MYVQTSLLDLKEHASSLASSGLKKDSKLKSMEIILEQKKEECLKLENQLKRVRSFSTNMMLHNHFPSFNTNRLLSGPKCNPGGSGQHRAGRAH